MNEREQELLQALTLAFKRDRRICTAFVDQRTGIALQCDGHFRGLWRAVDGGYAFFPSGYGAPKVVVAGVSEAIAYTLEHACP